MKKCDGYKIKGRWEEIENLELFGLICSVFYTLDVVFFLLEYYMNIFNTINTLIFV